MQNLGSCCECGREGPEVRGFLMLPWRSPEPGGWGCLLCGLEMTGAIAVLCDDCGRKAEASESFLPKYAVLGYPAENRRIPVEQLTEPFAHDLSKHAAAGERLLAEIEEMFDEVIDEYENHRKKTYSGDGGI